MHMAGKRALITGAKGFTGRYMAAELRAHGYQVFGMGIGPAEAGESNYRQADLTDAATLRALVAEVKPDVVVHLAGVAFVEYGITEDFYRVNLLGTRNLLDAIASSEHAVSSVLLVSSANVYGNASEGVLTENAPLVPANDYAVSKMAMEYMASLWKATVPFIIVRPFNYSGIGQSDDFVLPHIVNRFRRRAEVIELGNLDISRDFNDVRTVVSLYRRLLETPGAIDGIFNICSGKAYSLRQVVSMCEEMTGHAIRLTVNPALVRNNDVKTLVGDNSRLHGLLGTWDAPSLSETLAWMLVGNADADGA